MKRLAAVAAICCAAVLAACGGGSEVTGTIAGASLTPVDQAAVAGTVVCFGGNLAFTEIAVRLSSVAGECSAGLQDNHKLKNSTSLVLRILLRGGSTPAPGTGRWAVW